MSLNHTYQIAAGLREKAARLKMRDFEWRFLLAFDGKKTAQEIATGCHMDKPVAAELLLKLRQQALLVEAELSLDEFLSQNALPAIPLENPPVVNPSFPPTDSEGLRLGSAAAPAPITFSIRRNAAIDSLSAARMVAGLMSNRTLSALTPAEGNGAAKDSTAISRAELAVEFSVKREKFKLKPVIDFIIDRAGGGTVGQLAVYRVFLKIPPQLLHAAKVNSLNLVTDDTEIDHPPFRDAVLHSVTETLGVSFPAGSPG